MNQAYQGKALGAFLIDFIKAYFLFDNKTGCRFVTVDAYRSAMPFYERNGFLPLLAEDDGEMTRLLYFDLSDYQNNMTDIIPILKNMETLKRMPFKARKAVFKKLEEIADVASLSGEERERYENSVNAYRTHLCVIGAAEKKGIEEGIKEGTEKALQATARKMKAKGFDYDTISEITGLTIEEIGEL